MKEALCVYNSLTGKKEPFIPIRKNHVGMYVCGPTLYSEPHMGNMRTFINFDLVYRYLLHKGFSVKYVRNITDAGHITNSAGVDEDSISKAAREEQVQPLEIVYKYNVRFQELQRLYNLLPPTIEPTATSHMEEQIACIEKIIENGFAYEKNGSVYFNTKKYNEQHDYGVLSGRKLDELDSATRELNAQEEKAFFADFALWKKANTGDMQIWNSPWGKGNPGWHIECTAMSTKYLGEHFDIHGGGMDLKFPHHEDEIAQNQGCFKCSPANYWMHANMLNVNGKKMSKSLGNFFLPKEIIEGSTSLFKKAYSPEVIRFFMMQSHYRSTLDLTEAALDASEKGLKRLLEGIDLLEKIEISSTSTVNVEGMVSNYYAAMDDDFNAPVLISQLFETIKIVNQIKENQATISEKDKLFLLEKTTVFLTEVLGIQRHIDKKDDRLGMVMEMVIAMRKSARDNKNWELADQIRDGLSKSGIVIKDHQEGSTWE